MVDTPPDAALLKAPPPLSSAMRSLRAAPALDRCSQPVLLVHDRRPHIG